MISAEFEKTRPRCGSCVHFVRRNANDGMCTIDPPQALRPVPRALPRGKLLGSSAMVAPGQQAIDLVDYQTVRFGAGSSAAKIPYYDEPIAGPYAVKDVEAV